MKLIVDVNLNYNILFFIILYNMFIFLFIHRKSLFYQLGQAFSMSKFVEIYEQKSRKL